MFYDDINEDVTNMVQKELEHANSMFPPFHSLHEAYAVIKEEVEEADLDMEMVKQRLEWFWLDIIDDEEKLAFDVIDKIKEYAILSIKEAVQVCAMCQKALDSLSKESTK